MQRDMCRVVVHARSNHSLLPDVVNINRARESNRVEGNGHLGGDRDAGRVLDKADIGIVLHYATLVVTLVAARAVSLCICCQHDVIFEVYT